MYWLVENNNVVKVFSDLWSYPSASFPASVTTEKLKEFGIYFIRKENKNDWEYWGELVEYQIREDDILEIREKTNKNLEDYKNEKINILKNKCKRDILNEYTEATQRNILINKEEDLTSFVDMKNFIDNRRVEYSNEKATILGFETHLQVYNYYNDIVAPIIDESV